MKAIETERVLLEAELIIAPVKCRLTMQHVAKCVDAFTAKHGRPPMDATIGAIILKDLLAYEADAVEVQWFIDLGLMPAGFMAEWEAARA